MSEADCKEWWSLVSMPSLALWPCYINIIINWLTILVTSADPVSLA